MPTNRYDYAVFLVRYKRYPCITNQIQIIIEVDIFLKKSVRYNISRTCGFYNSLIKFCY